jgi:hypothetical protein
LEGDPPPTLVGAKKRVSAIGCRHWIVLQVAEPGSRKRESGFWFPKGGRCEIPNLKS